MAKVSPSFICVPGNRAPSIPSFLAWIWPLADTQSLLTVWPSIQPTACSQTLRNSAWLCYLLIPLFLKLMHGHDVCHTTCPASCLLPTVPQSCQNLKILALLASMPLEHTNIFASPSSNFLCTFSLIQELSIFSHLSQEPFWTQETQDLSTSHLYNPV
jgi:hypothetical protein